MRSLEREFYRVPELAAKLGLTDDAIWAKVRKGFLPSVKFGGAILIPKAEVDRIIKENTREAVKV